MLTASGERERASENSGDRFYCYERRFGHFSRSVTLPAGVNEEGIRANYTSGVLIRSLTSRKTVSFITTRSVRGSMGLGVLPGGRSAWRPAAYRAGAGFRLQCRGLAFGTSARSDVLTDWPAGGYIGIHGTDRPELLPGRVSHGCIRLRNADILRLAELMPVGTPLTIR